MPNRDALILYKFVARFLDLSESTRALDFYQGPALPDSEREADLLCCFLSRHREIY